MVRSARRGSGGGSCEMASARSACPNWPRRNRQRSPAVLLHLQPDRAVVFLLLKLCLQELGVVLEVVFGVGTAAAPSGLGAGVVVLVL